MKTKYTFSHKKIIVILLAIPFIFFNYKCFAQISMTITGSTSQNFNTLREIGGTWNDNSTIANWYWQNSYEGTSYNGDDGSTQPTSATRFAYHSSESPDMAMGGVAINSDHVAMGVQLKNNSGAVIEELKVSYTGEQWHFGGNSIVSKITFWYKISSSAITDLTPGDDSGWTAVTDLDFSSPIHYSGDPSALDGNASENKSTFLNISIPNLSIPTGNYIMLRWAYNDQNSPHGIAIDDVKIDWVGNSVITAGKWSRSTNWNWGTPDAYTNAIINGSITADANNACNNLIIYSEKSLTVNSGVTITVNGKCLIKSSSSGVGSLLNNGTLSIAGTSNVEMYIPATTIHNGIYFTPPLSNVNASTVSDLVYRYNASTCSWTIVYSQLLPGTGYTVRSDNEITKTLSSGSFRNTDLNVVGLVRQSSPQNYGWNLVGNPFVCGLDWELLNDNTSNYTNLTNGFYIRASDGSLKSYVNGVGTPSGTSSVIPPFQGFYAQVVIGQTTGSIKMPISARTNNNHLLYKNQIPIVRLQINSPEGFSDEMVIRIDDNASDNFDQSLDANKMFAFNDSDPQIFSISEDNEELCINAVKIKSITSVPVCYKALIEGAYSIKAFDFSSLDKSISIFLKDNLTNTIQNLREQPIYYFNTSATFNNDRFVVLLSKQSTSVCKDFPNSKISINAINKTIYVDLQDETNGFVEIYNLLGEKIMNNSITGTSIQQINLDVNTGIYIVKVSTNNSSSTKKVIIK